MTPTVRIGLALLACGALAPRPATAEDKPLTVCALPAALPRTGKAPDGTPRGLDVAVARLVGKALGRPVEFHWCAGPACGWNCLREGRCDVVAGQPIDSGPPRDLAWSVPYAGARFGLVVPRGVQGIRSMDDLRGKRVGIVAGTVVLSDHDHAVARFKTREEVLDRFEADRLDGAFLDADFAAWYLKEHPAPALRAVPEYVPRERWNMALAVRAGDGALLRDLNRALAELAASGAIRHAYDALGVPHRPPFTNDDRKETALDTGARLKERGELVVAFDPANLPYSSAKEDRPGFEVELARALAERLGVKLRIDWLDVQRETALGQLLERRCDLAFGEAVADNLVADDAPIAGKVLYSTPYYGTGYVLVRRREGPRVGSLAELKGDRSHRIGAEAGSVADYSLRQRGYQRRLYRNQLATLKALADKDIDAAYLWANVGWTLHTSPDFPLEIIPEAAPEDHWNIAVALAPGDGAFKSRVDAALDALRKDGTVARALARYHVPYFDPFPEPGAPIHHGVRERGPEPQLRTVQRSKAPYSGLEKVRAAGVLVVGLDPNNLPFSTAHPAPAGLDHELAGLLAEELGVAPRVFWGYSSHDSYPSKLAVRELCDVILGVMPDDRFARRVLYTRPYHVATYRVAVRSGAGLPGSDAPIAVEEGVAVRGLSGRATHSYPSTEAVLEAVASGRERAGYVVSTRGPWLASRRWPDAIDFLDLPGSPDRFPISAAVRKADGDLKEALDRALDALDRSGRLAEVFARWHVPHGAKAAEPPAVEPCGAVPLDAPAQPPRDEAAHAEGQALFRGLCSGCHGGAGRGGKGPDLTDSRWLHGDTDADITRVIENGVPKTTMKKLGEALKPDQIRKVVAYIRTLARGPSESAWKPYMPGDPKAGRALVFDAKSKLQCVKCHSIGGEGGRIGPALDRIASRRAPEFIMESIVLPSKEIAPEYEAVAVATTSGRVITGLRVNETNFSIQLTEENGRFHSFLKRDLDEVKVLKASLMPANIPELLTVKDLHDVFAYLMTLE